MMSGLLIVITHKNGGQQRVGPSLLFSLLELWNEEQTSSFFFFSKNILTQLVITITKLQGVRLKTIPAKKGKEEQVFSF